MRDATIRQLAERGISFEQLAEQAQQPDADPLDLLCHLAFNAPLRTRRERAQRLKSERKDFFAQYSPPARQILDELLEKYAEHGDAQFVLPEVLRVPPISDHGQPGEIMNELEECSWEQAVSKAEIAKGTRILHESKISQCVYSAA